MLNYTFKKLFYKNSFKPASRFCVTQRLLTTPSKLPEEKDEVIQHTEPTPEVITPQGNFFTRNPYVRLARMNSQIGTHLLLIPCYWGIMLGTPGFVPNWYTVGLFSVGALGCRSAGCIINDFADRDIDKHVDRTKARPLTTGELSPKQAGVFLSGLMAMNFGVLFSLPTECIKLGLAVTPVVFLYPTAKRWFRYPQVILGTTFNSGVMIGYAAAAANHAVNWQVCLPFYAGGILWTVYYDSIYAFQDRTFDKKLNLNSTAILMEKSPKRNLILVSAATLAFWSYGGYVAGFSELYYGVLAAMGSQMFFQIARLDIENRERCFKQFKANRYIGLTMLLALFCGKFMFFRDGVTSYVKNENGEFEKPQSYDKNIERIDLKIKENKVMIFSWSWCPFCKKARELLDDAGVEYETIKIDRQDDNVNLQNALVYKTGYRKVPNIFIDGQHIGGHDSLKAALESGKLKEMLDKSGVKNDL